MLNSPQIADTTLSDTEAPLTLTLAERVGLERPAEAASLERTETLCDLGQRTETLCDLGQRTETLCDLGRFGDAVPVAGQLIAEDPRNVGAWCLMARAQLGSDRATAALSAAQAAASLAPGDDLPHRLASSALSRLGRDEEAILAAVQATRCAPSVWEGHAQLAHCLSSFSDRLGDAQAAADRAVSLMPNDPGPHLAAGAVALADGRRDDAAAAFCAALAVDPQCGDAHNQLANLQTRGRDRKRRSLRPRLRRRSRGRPARPTSP